MSKHPGIDFLIGVAVGAAIGAAAGILLAPASGKETRRYIGDKTKDAVCVTKNTAIKVKHKISDKFDKMKENFDDRVEDAFEAEED